MTRHGHLSVKNQTIPGRYHHKNSACAVRFANSRMAAPYHNSRGAK